MLKAITAAKKKNDRADAEMIADLLRVNLLPECHMLSEEIRELRRISRYRNHIVRTAVKMRYGVRSCFLPGLLEASAAGEELVRREKYAARPPLKEIFNFPDRDAHVTADLKRTHLIIFCEPTPLE